MTVGKTAKISSPSMKRRKSALGEDDDLEQETKALASFYPSPPPVDFVQSTVSYRKFIKIYEFKIVRSKFDFITNCKFNLNTIYRKCFFSCVFLKLYNFCC